MLAFKEKNMAMHSRFCYYSRTTLLQKISLEWLNWNAQFFDYSDEPYLFYLAELLSKDLTNDSANLGYSFGLNGQLSSENRSVAPNELPRFMNLLKQMNV